MLGRMPQLCQGYLQQPLIAKERSLLVLSVGEAVRIEEQGIAQADLNRPPLPTRILEQPQRHACPAQRLDRATILGGEEVGRIVPGVAVGQHPRGRVEYSVENSDKLVGVDVTQKTLVGSLQYQLWLGAILAGECADQRAAQDHEQGRAHPLVGHIGDQHPQLPVGQRDQVIEIAGGLSGRFQAGCYLPARDDRQGSGQQARLHLPGQVQLSVELSHIEHLSVAQSFLLQASIDPCFQQHRVKGLGQVVLCPHLDAPRNVAHIVQGRDHDDRDVSQRLIRFEVRQHLEPVHLGHHDIQQDQIRLLCRDPGQRLPTIPRSGCHTVQVLQLLLQVVYVKGLVIDDQDLGPLVHYDSPPRN